MKTDPVNESALFINSTGVSTVTRAMVRSRAAELALIDGRAVGGLSKSDWEQAKRELTGGCDLDPHEALLEAAPESERWDPLPGSPGQIVTVPSSDGDNDEDGKSLGERLTDKGVDEAEHDQMVQAARDENKQGL
jgi:hypothetical protein